MCFTILLTIAHGWVNLIFYTVLSSISGEVSEPCPGGSVKYLRFDDKVSNQEAANRCAAIGAVLPYVGEQEIWDVSSNAITNSDLNRPCFALRPYGKSFKTELVIVKLAIHLVPGYSTQYGI